MIWTAEAIGSRGGKRKRHARNIIDLAKKLRRAKAQRVQLITTPRFNLPMFWESKLQELVSMTDKQFKRIARRSRRAVR